MSVFVIADLHLSLGTGKPMDVFEGWSDYVERIDRNWKRIVKQTDTVVIPGDISWAMSLEESLTDLMFIDSLPGRKIISKGNHDYWWTTMKKLMEFKEKHGLDSIDFMFNNSFEAENISICGTRGWIFETGKEEDLKIIEREAGRLRRSLESRPDGRERVVFLHYPPIYQNQRAEKIISIMKEFSVRRCYYGHLHSRTISYAFNGEEDGISYRLISSDSLEFCPYIID